MENILEQIIQEQKVEELRKLDAMEIIDNLFSDLMERERDVLSRRFGLRGNKETLEKIGQAHQLTRERIRQIEASSVKKIKKLETLEGNISILRQAIAELLEEHGGLMERNYLLNILSVVCASQKDIDKEVYKNHFDFLISKLFKDRIEVVKSSDKFHSFYKLKDAEIKHLEELAEDLNRKVDELKQTFKTEEIIDLITKLEMYNKNKVNFNFDKNSDFSTIFEDETFPEKAEVINNNKILYSFLMAIKNIEQNKFGEWGKDNWNEIKPKTVNDKIYLVLKNNGKPMHFTEIADRINEIKFDKKKANAATVHNELILDERYILVGRGVYGLREWGYKKGVVIDVIKDILKDSKIAMSRDDIIEKVLENRLVKKATVVLALNNKEIFERQEDGNYKLKA